MKTLLKLPTTGLLLDNERKLMVATLKGNIDFEDYKAMLMGTIELAAQDQAAYVILDRRQIRSLSTECRLWVKNFYIKQYAKPVAHKIKKIAIVESRSTVGQLYGKAIHTAMRLMYPNLKMKYFKNYNAAEAWIEDDHRGSLSINEVIDNEHHFFNDVMLLEQQYKNQRFANSSTNNYTMRKSQSSGEVMELGKNWLSLQGVPNVLGKWVSVIFP
ncbi:MAG: STAS/SEC14 domain-containing protein [Bacteroidota bacterium]